MQIHIWLQSSIFFSAMATFQTQDAKYPISCDSEQVSRLFIQILLSNGSFCIQTSNSTFASYTNFHMDLFSHLLKTLKCFPWQDFGIPGCHTATANALFGKIAFSRSKSVFVSFVLCSLTYATLQLISIALWQVTESSINNFHRYKVDFGPEV